MRGWHRCEACWRATRPHLRDREAECAGVPRVAAETHPTHKLRSFCAGGEAVFVCLGCGAYGAKHTRLLGAPCLAQGRLGKLPDGRARVLRRVERGYHPSGKPHLNDFRLE